jgi:hypothetical protein
MIEHQAHRPGPSRPVRAITVARRLAGIVVGLVVIGALVWWINPSAGQVVGRYPDGTHRVLRIDPDHGPARDVRVSRSTYNACRVGMAWPECAP